MIIRSIIEDPDQPFDFYNDAKDTINWLNGYARDIVNNPQRFEDPPNPVKLFEIALTLQAKFDEWKATIWYSATKRPST
jgi:hypothetical protein